MRQMAFLVVGLMLCCGLGPAGIQADDAPTVQQDNAERRGPLPYYFGKLGMSDGQKQQAYKVQDEYDAKIEDLKNQLKALLAERDQKLESLLSPGQKLRYKELLDAAQQKAAVKDAPPVGAAK